MPGEEIRISTLAGNLLSVVRQVSDAGKTAELNLLDNFKQWSSYLAAGVEICAAIVIGIAALEAILSTFMLFIRRYNPPEAKENVRLGLGRWLAVALEFGLAADILRTAVAPTWNEIGQLIVIAFLRTALNFFLQQEIDRAVARQPKTTPVFPTNSQDEQPRQFTGQD